MQTKQQHLQQYYVAWFDCSQPLTHLYSQHLVRLQKPCSSIGLLTCPVSDNASDSQICNLQTASDKSASRCLRLVCSSSSQLHSCFFELVSWDNILCRWCRVGNQHCTVPTCMMVFLQLLHTETIQPQNYSIVGKIFALTAAALSSMASRCDQDPGLVGILTYCGRASDIGINWSLCAFTLIALVVTTWRLRSPVWRFAWGALFSFLMAFQVRGTDSCS